MRLSGLPFIFREIIQRKYVTVLYFHDIGPDAAELSFKLLKSLYNVISLNTFLDAYNSHKLENLPAKSLIITFDDGHKENYRLLPIINKYRVPITIFLCMGIVGTNRHYWWTERPAKISFNKLMNLSNKKRLKILMNYGFSQKYEYDERQALLTDEIKEMALVKYINFESHTLFHPFLDRCDYNESLIECLKSKILLENDYGINVRSLSYPNGNYSQKVKKLLKLIGYECAFTVKPGYNNYKTDLFELKRFSTNDTTDINELIVKASGIWRLITFNLNKMS